MMSNLCEGTCYEQIKKQAEEIEMIHESMERCKSSLTAALVTAKHPIYADCCHDFGVFDFLGRQKCSPSRAPITHAMPLHSQLFTVKFCPCSTLPSVNIYSLNV